MGFLGSGTPSPTLHHEEENPVQIEAVCVLASCRTHTNMTKTCSNKVLHSREDDTRAHGSCPGHRHPCSSERGPGRGPGGPDQSRDPATPSSATGDWLSQGPELAGAPGSPSLSPQDRWTCACLEVEEWKAAGRAEGERTALAPSGREGTGSLRGGESLRSAPGQSLPTGTKLPASQSLDSGPACKSGQAAG